MVLKKRILGYCDSIAIVEDRRCLIFKLNFLRRWFLAQTSV